MSTPTPSAPKKKRRLAQYAKNITDAYTISRRTFPWIGWAMLGVLVVLLAAGVGIAAATSQSYWYWVLLAVMTALLIDMIILSWAVRRASFTQIEGIPGATKAVLDQVGKGWFVEENPAAINPKTQDIVWRAIGRPGVVLLSEGPTERTRKLLNDTMKKTSRIVGSTVPVHTVTVGTAKGQVRLVDLPKVLRKLPTKPVKLTDAEIAQVSKRLSSLAASPLSAPKGIDPLRARPDHRAMRGR